MKLRCDTMKYLYLHEKLLVESVADLIPQIKGGGGLKKSFSDPLGLRLVIKQGGAGPRAPPLDPTL